MLLNKTNHPRWLIIVVSYFEPHSMRIGFSELDAMHSSMSLFPFMLCCKLNISTTKMRDLRVFILKSQACLRHQIISHVTSGRWTHEKGEICKYLSASSIHSTKSITNEFGSTSLSSLIVKASSKNKWAETEK